MSHSSNTLTTLPFRPSKNTAPGSWKGALETWQMTQTCHRRPHAQPGSLLEAFEPICLTRDGLGLVSRAVSAWYQHFSPATARLKF